MSLSSQRLRVGLYLGRVIRKDEEILETLDKVLDQAEADQADANAYRVLLADTQHLIKFNEVGWVIQHPGSERVLGRLFDCPVASGVRFENPPSVMGVYECDFEETDDRVLLHLGEKVSE